MTITPKPFVLIILDGWGHREETKYNPTKKIETPVMDELLASYPNTLLKASGEAVGLPAGQIGNSEVGHLHIGAGRKVPQDLTRIELDIATGDFYQNEIFRNAIAKAKQNKRSIHILGLLSPGGVHSHENQIMALIDLISEHEVDHYYLHAILDGRDVPPKSALKSIEHFSAHCDTLPGCQFASIIGRYYAMDRDKRWERTQKAYDLLTEGKTEYHADTPKKALEMAYQRNETDEFVKPTAIHKNNESPITLQDDDVVIFMNFRADRARQLTRALTESDFSGFHRDKIINLADFVTLTEYAKDINAQVAYPPLQLENTLGEYLSNQKMTQLRIAETEKYAHVTYFLNGGVEQAYPKEDRILVPSPKVATYDLQPEMSAIELTDKLVEAIESDKYDVIMCNYANPDMVGHTGNEKAAEKAVSVIDTCLGRIVKSIKKVGGEAFITSDHGNIELMFDEKTGQAHTAHTTNLAPLIYIGRPAVFEINDGALDDIAPTILYLIGKKPPEEMTGRCLLHFKEEEM